MSSEIIIDDSSSLLISSQVQDTIDQVLSSEDPLDKSDFNAIDYINTIFPSEQSLTNIDDVLTRMKEKMRMLDQEIRVVVRGQSGVENEGREALEEARRVISHLTGRIMEIKEQAKKSETMVDEITGDIKQLDNAKRNLTSSIIMLNNLHILVEGVDKLSEATRNRSYGIVASILQSVNDVFNQLEKQRHIPHIKQLSLQIDGIKTKLSEQIKTDFKSILDQKSSKKSNTNLATNQLRQLAEACLVISTLFNENEPNPVKDELLTWFIQTELSEYEALFQDNQDLAWLDKVDKRYSWLKNHLIQFEERFGRLFPPKWKVSECIAIAFCRLTAKQLGRVMSNRANEMNVRLLLFAFTKTVAFENLLNQRFSGITLIDSENSLNPFSGLIIKSFEPHLKIYIDAQEKNLTHLIDSFVEDWPKRETTAEIFPSAGILFSQYKNCLVQCVQLSTGRPLVDLANKFKKNIEDYATRVLSNNLPRIKSGGLSSSVSVINAAISATGLPISLKEDETTRYSRTELCTICSILLTANYCLETVRLLEKKLAEKVDKSLVSQINMVQEQDLFHRIITNCIDLLIQDIEIGCESAFTLMIKTSWPSSTPSETSPYVKTLSAGLSSTFPLLREYLDETRKYYSRICLRFLQVFIPRYNQALYKCRPLSPKAVDQLLVDIQWLRLFLCELPGCQSDIKSAPGGYVKQVMEGLGRVECMLRVICQDVDGLVEAYMRLMPNAGVDELGRLLEMKGCKRSERDVLIEVFKMKKEKDDNKRSEKLNKK